MREYREYPNGDGPPIKAAFCRPDGLALTPEDEAAMERIIRAAARHAVPDTTTGREAAIRECLAIAEDALRATRNDGKWANRQVEQAEEAIRDQIRELLDQSLPPFPAQEGTE